MAFSTAVFWIKAHASSVLSAPIWCAVCSMRTFSSSEGDCGRDVEEEGEGEREREGKRGR